LLPIANAAWRRHRDLGLTAETFDQFRRRECQAACGAFGFTRAVNSQFRAIRSHFSALAGRPGDHERSLADALNTGRAGHPAAPAETVEDRDQALWLVRDALRKRGLRALQLRNLVLEALAALLVVAHHVLDGLHHDGGLSTRDATSV
jgi:hypothetical protein